MFRSEIRFLRYKIGTSTISKNLNNPLNKRKSPTELPRKA